MTITLPIRPITGYPAALQPAIAQGLNGKLGLCNLTDISLAGIGHASLEPTVKRCFSALQIYVLSATGKTLTATSGSDCYRSFDVQYRGFFNRYTPSYDPAVNVLHDQRVFNGIRYYLRIGRTPCAVPGTSNHGYGCAVDMAIYDPATAHIMNIRNDANLFFNVLIPSVDNFGFCWENPMLGVDDPHIRYWAADDIQQGVLNVEAMIGHTL
jgi:hypothetical protein